MKKTLRSSMLALGVVATLTASAAAQNLTVNGDFEAGDTSGWDSFPTATSTFAVTGDANSGSFAGQIVNNDMAAAAVVKQSFLGAGTIMPGATVDISFAAKGTTAVGGVLFAEFFTEISGGGVSSATLLGGAPVPITSSWQTFTFQVTANADVSGGVTLQIAAITGAAMGSSIDVIIDDVTVEATNNVVELSPYTENFEGLDMMNPGALGAADWKVFANVFDGGGGFLYNYGPFPAPNGGPGFCGITTNEGGPDQGAQQLVTYSDYNNGDHNNGFVIESSVFQEQIVGAGDVGKTFVFQFDAKAGDRQDPSTTIAFIKIIDGTVFSLDGFAQMDTTGLPTNWGTYSISITIEPQHVGDFFQIGFQTNATNFNPSGMIYDNIVFGEGSLGTNYCMAAPNSTGGVATISASGSAMVSENDLTLSVAGLPAGQTGIFIVSPDQGFFPGLNGNSNGNLCLSGSIARFVGPGQIFTSDMGGASTLSFDITQIPQGGMLVPTLPGQTWNFQAWYRDVVGLGSNLTDGISITFM